MKKSAAAVQRMRVGNIRKFERFMVTMANPHPPVKGVSARKKWKNVTMTRRLRAAATLRVVRAHEQRVKNTEAFLATTETEVTVL